MSGEGAVRRRRWPRRLLRVLVVALVVLAALGAGGWFWLRGRLEASLPQLDGKATVPGLGAPASVERDALGVPTVRGSSRLDVARALGFLHGQERFFQMDLLRRGAAGELAALLGAPLVGSDRRLRAHRFREIAGRSLHEANPEIRDLLTGYSDGVNAGLQSLDAPAPEYILLRTDPVPWKTEDSLLVLSAMFLQLQDSRGGTDRARGLILETLPLELSEFLMPAGTEWDAPVVGGAVATTNVPGPEIYDLRGQQRGATLEETVPRAHGAPEVVRPGSNNWAVAGTWTADGGALLAGDMHLGLSMPNIWYRASLVWPDGSGGNRRVTGVTLPGTPALTAGSTGDVAWAYTNTGGDWTDVVIVEVDPDDENRYRTPDGWTEFDRVEEVIEVRGDDDEAVELVGTIWGPVVGHDRHGRPLVLHWVAHFPGATGENMLELELVENVDDAIAVAQRSRIPAQNFVVVDRGGRIGWTVAGRIPRRFGHDGQQPLSWADGTRGWDGWLQPDEYPSVIDPEAGRIWTANNRVANEVHQRVLGYGGLALGARAGQIRDGLLALERATAEDLLAIQLDDRSLFLERWRDLLLITLDDETLSTDPRLAELRSVVEQTWTGRASIDSAAYRMVRAFRFDVGDKVMTAVTAPCGEVDEDFRYWRATGQWEAPLWTLVTEQPPHLLGPGYASWHELLVAVAVGIADYFEEQPGESLRDKSWGARNTVRIQHPLARAVPLLSGWLDIVPEQLPGDSNMPRVQTPGFGASQRMIVSPGREEEGLFHMPGGQSGHPLSPFYRAGHRAWADGTPTPFLPGPAVHTLTLLP